MATCWLLPIRTRIRLDVLPSRLWLQARSHLSIALQTPSPASLEVETIPYPTSQPDASVFESMSQEYATVATPSARLFTPLTSSETLAALVLKGDFRTAESLRKEMISHQIPIPNDALYLRAALHAITARRPKGSSKERLDAFIAWLSLVPDRNEEWQSFHDIRQRLFLSMDHLNLTLVYRFGLVLASKGYYSGDSAMQVVSMLARYAQPSVVERYLCQVENASRGYLSKKGIDPPSDLLVGSYSLAIRTIALAGKGEAALGLVSIAQLRRIRISDFALSIVAGRQTPIDRIRAVHPSWAMEQTTPHLVRVESESMPTVDGVDVSMLAARLRSLRVAMKSNSPPSPRALHSFVTSYQALGRTRALTLLRSLALRHSPKSASTWAFTEMLHHRSRRDFVRVLSVFTRHFHPVGIPRKTLFSLVRGARGRQVHKKDIQRELGIMTTASCSPMKEKLWPSAYHTAIVWEAIVSLSSKNEHERLYTLLTSLVRQSRQHTSTEQNDDDYRSETENDAGVDRVRLQLPPDTFDAAHFSPFVSLWARLGPPVRAARVLQDMVHLGIGPSPVQWSIVARGYAQHDDPLVALRILDGLEEAQREAKTTTRADAAVATERMNGIRGAEGDAERCSFSSDALLGVHTNVLRGFVLAEDVQHAREVETRLVERLGYQAGSRAATDASITLLRGLEEKLLRSVS